VTEQAGALAEARRHLRIQRGGRGIRATRTAQIRRGDQEEQTHYVPGMQRGRVPLFGRPRPRDRGM